MEDIVVLGLFGLIVGSFLNVIIYRLPREMKWVNGRSHCTSCKAKLRWYELVPVMSWIWLGGKCRSCKARISVVYPLVELMNSVLWMSVGWMFANGGWLAGINGEMIGNTSGLGLGLLLVFCSVLVVIFWIDWFHYIIPDSTVVMIVGIGLLLGILQWWSGDGGTGMLERVMWGVGALSFFGLLYFLTKGRGMGLGDVKLVLGLGLVLGVAMGVALMAAFVLGAAIGLMLLGLKLRKLGQPIPFGPFLVIGSLVGLMWGEEIVVWYLGGI